MSYLARTCGRRKRLAGIAVVVKLRVMAELVNTHQIQKYGLLWPERTSPLKIEFDMIRAGGYKQIGGKRYGEGLLQHFLAARRLAWPDRYEHRWTRLIYEEIIKNAVTILMGAASTGKTSHAAEWLLLDYWCYPYNTLALVTTTTLDKLESNIFGEIKTLWGQAKERYPWLAGNILDHKHSIFTDDIENITVRDRRRGIIGKACYEGKQWVGDAVFVGIKQQRVRYIGDECFPGDTMVDTPGGQRRIDSIQVGDYVMSGAGPNRVKGIKRQFVERLIRITTRDAREIVCTPEHRFLTQQGWKKAVDLTGKHYMVGTHEAMSILQQGTCNTSTINLESAKVLQSVLRRQMDHEPTQHTRQSVQQISECKTGYIQNKVVETTSGNCIRAFSKDEAIESDAYSCDLCKGSRQDSILEMQTANTWRKWHWTNKGRESANRYVPARPVELPDQNQTKSWQWISNLLQSGFGDSSVETCDRSRWIMPQQSSTPTTGSEENKLLAGAWVDCCEILQQDDFEKEFSGAKRIAVYNLHVEGHHTYSVNGLLAKNCQFMAGTWLRSWNTLFSNPDVKIIGSGNPNHNPDDPLGIAAEPKDGWASLPEPEVTATWNTRHLDGRCVNLVGTDSPNFDVPEDQPEPYARLIGRKFMRRVVHDSGPESPDFYRLVKGVMKFSLAHTRVITRQLCRDHKAHDKAEWLDEKRTKIYAVDPAYGGGDRCVAGYIEFGKGIDGKQILRVNPPRVIQINLKMTMPPEDQIADSVFNDLQRYDIPPENCFYGAFGKGTIGFAFARKFGAKSPVPLEEGGRPTKRAVRQDLRIFDETRREVRQKRCDEHYSKRITEYWFSTRYAIEAEQVRELPEDVMAEGCMREYKTVGGNLIEVESKEDMRERLSRSPDLYDWFTFTVEGARQRGFVISSLGPGDEDESKNDDWLRDKVNKHLSLVRSKRVMVTS